MKNKFKVGDKVICIAKPPQGFYQCDVGAKATVSNIVSNISIQTKEAICNNYNAKIAKFNPKYFKLYKPLLSFKKLHKL